MTMTSKNLYTVTPKPAFCVKLSKTKNVGGGGEVEKIFFNFCTCRDEVPPPADDIDEDSLARIVESSNPGSYRVPIAVGEPHEEEDKRGESCTAYDIVINEAFYKKRVADSELFRAFLTLVAIDAVESKYFDGALIIDRSGWIQLKNRKCVGELRAQKVVRNEQSREQLTLSSKLIEELPDEASARISKKVKPEAGIKTNSSSPKIISSSAAAAGDITPKYELRKDDAKNPTKLIATFYLGIAGGAVVQSASDFCLDIAEHRIRVCSRKDKMYEVDVYVDISLDEHSAKAKLLVEEQKLVVEIALRQNT